LIARDVMVNVPLYGLDFVRNMGVYCSRDGSGHIQVSDRNECIRRSSNIVKESYQRVVHVVPVSYRVDGQAVQNPVGVLGSNLDVETHVVLGDSDTILDVMDCLSLLNLRMRGMVYDPMASSQLFLSDSLRQSGAYLLDIGHDVSKFSFFQNGVLVFSHLLPIGGSLFTSDISKIMKVSFDDAERLKVLYGDLNQKTFIRSASSNDTFIIFEISEVNKDPPIGSK
jgi:cell division protein FtsA